MWAFSPEVEIRKEMKSLVLWEGRPGCSRERGLLQLKATRDKSIHKACLKGERLPQPLPHSRLPLPPPRTLVPASSGCTLHFILENLPRITI